MGETFRRKFQARWGDMDFNSHMANRAYLDVAADVRMMFFAENGFPMSEFERLKLGPVVQKDEIEYYRELRLLDNMEVEHCLAGISDDGSKFRFRNTFYRDDGKKAATVTTTAGWLDLNTRKLVPPPAPLHEAMLRLSRTEDFTVLASISK